MLYGKSLILSGDFMQSAWYHDISDLKRLWINLIDHRQMRDNFRNTLETLQHAHSVFGDQASSLFLAQRVIKRWPHPLQIQDSSTTTIVKHLQSLVESISSKETVAIIYYDKQFATHVYEWYTSDAPDHALFPSLDQDHHDELISGYYSRQVYFISYRESKGLEFDHVILIDQQWLLGSDLHYKKKLWYIGCTRAVKTLGVVS
jgi:DNA helicase IV